MSKIIRIEREQRLRSWLEKIEFGGISRSKPEACTRELINLYLAYLRTTSEIWPNFSDEEFVIFNRNATSNLIGFISLDPFIGPVKKAIVALMAGDVKKALSILQKIVNEQDAILAEIQRKNRTGGIKESDYIALLKKIYKSNPCISAKEMLATLKKEVGNGVIRQIKHDSNQIITTKGEEYNISGLKDKIHSFRKNKI